MPQASLSPQPLLRVEDLQMHFPVHRGVFVSKEVGTVKAVDGISFHLEEGETLGLVGESGCGKTTLGRCILRLDQPSGGNIFFQKHNLSQASAKDMKLLRKEIQVVFQDPYSSLNPRMSIKQIVQEGPLVHGFWKKASEAEKKVGELLELVGLPANTMHRFPHEMSGGQRQRVGIARALSMEPRFIICDEAVSALDVSIQAQIINLLQDLQEKLNLTYLFIAHDLSVVQHISHRVAVMYLGRIAELTSVDLLYSQPKHPYTKALLSAVPIPDPKVEAERELHLLDDEPPSPLNPPKGCSFHPRCEKATELCSQKRPVLEEKVQGQWVACHHVEKTPSPNNP